MHFRTILFFSLLTALATVFLASIYDRLVPESSPIARGAAHAAEHPCVDNACSAELKGFNHRCEYLEGHTSCADVAAYWYAMRLHRAMDLRLAQAPDNQLLLAEQLARQRNCFRCHGQLGQGGIANEGALKGYIPGYFGRDFGSLTEGGSAEAVAEWISTGSSRALTEHPLTGFLAEYFLHRQAVSMPDFSSLPEQEIELLTKYVLALNALGPLDSPGVEYYAEMTVSTQSNSGFELLLERSRTTNTSSGGRGYARQPTSHLSKSSR